MFRSKETKVIKQETVEEALARGIKVEKCECVMPNSIVYPDKYGMQRRKRRSKYKGESTKKVNVHELLAKCTPEQKAKLIPHLRKQGVEI